ncbi:MAG: DinB family protein [Anaerolineales bacterium]|nr:DinB family protein [Anaerolineales bacterium]
MEPDVLYWQPDREANNIAVTVWHVSRAFDFFKVRLFQNHPAAEELWHKNGWAQKTNYDPTGIGWGGFGNLSGYSQQEVKGVPALTARELVAYLEQVVEAMRDYIRGLPSPALYQPAVGYTETSRTIYEWLRALIADSFEHLGEIRTIEAMGERQVRPNRQEVE